MANRDMPHWRAHNVPEASSDPANTTRRASEDDNSPRARGVVRTAFYCDESGTSGDLKYYGFGALVLRYQKRGEFVQLIRRVREKHGCFDEIKWNKCSRQNLPFYKDLVEAFFRTSYLLFHCIVVHRPWVKLHEYHDGSIETAQQKHFTEFLANKVGREVRMNRGREVEVRLYVDKLPASYAKAGEVIQIIGNHRVNLMPAAAALKSQQPVIRTLQECVSHEYDEIQIADLLLGAVVGTWNDRAKADHRKALQKHMADFLRWPDLKADTHPHERKFNIWYLTDEFERRVVETRPVHLVHPLPERKRPRR